MNVSLQNIDKVSAELTVKLEKADYQEKVDKELKSLRQKAQTAPKDDKQQQQQEKPQKKNNRHRYNTDISPYFLNLTVTLSTNRLSANISIFMYIIILIFYQMVISGRT